MTDLFALDRLAAHLQMDLDEQSAIEAREIATADVETVVGQQLTAGVHDVTLEANEWGLLTLPRFPISSITSVATVSDAGVETAVAPASYRLTRQELQLLQYPLGYPYRVHVVYAFGSDDVAWLRTARSIALKAAGRLYMNPEQLRSESSLSYSRTSATDDSTLCLTRGEVRQLRRRYGGAAAYSVTIGH